MKWVQTGQFFDEQRAPTSATFCQTEKWMETRVSIESMEDRTLYIHEEGGKKY
jgi:hypothetical protein